MANHKSEIKRAKQNVKKNMRNKAVKTRIKNVIKSVRAAIEEKSKDTAKAAVITAQSVLQRASQKGVIHNNTASRKISRLMQAVNAIP